MAMGLPWLESLAVWGSESTPTRTGNESFPKRFAALFMGNGINAPLVGYGSGDTMELSQSLQPVEPLKKLNVGPGLFIKHATGVGIHPGQTATSFRCVPMRCGLKGGVSMDQVLARHLGESTVQPSLVLGCEQPITGYHETNFSMAYSSHISWRDANSPVPMEVYPSLAFDSLYENLGTKRTLSILDRAGYARS
jgi:hypothetical protein